MDTIKVEKGRTRMIAHRGVSGLEKENSNAAFVAAGSRSYYGIECDVRKTADGVYVILHDDTTERVAQTALHVRECTYEELAGIVLNDMDGTTGRTDLRIPRLSEYISICRRYGKKGVLELKDPFTREEITEITEIIRGYDYMGEMIFISFVEENLILLREREPAQPIQLLAGEYSEHVEKLLRKYRFDLDIHCKSLTEELVERLHGLQIGVNCWTCNNREEAERYVGWGVDYITTNILE